MLKDQMFALTISIQHHPRGSSPDLKKKQAKSKLNLQIRKEE